jgi:hypothetical protein
MLYARKAYPCCQTRRALPAVKRLFEALSAPIALGRLIRFLHQNCIPAVLICRLRRKRGLRLASRNISHFGEGCLPRIPISNERIVALELAYLRRPRDK